MRVVDMLERAARSWPTHPAVVVVDGPTVTYFELRRRVVGLAAALQARGVTRGDRLGIMSANGVGFFDVYLAAAYLGAAAVPVDVRLADDEVRFVLDDSEPVVGFADAANATSLARCSNGFDVIEFDSLNFSSMLATEEPGDLLDVARGEDIGLIIYTSGTTGRPKGVCLSQHALTVNALTMAVAQRLGHEDVFMSMTPMYHAATGTRVTSMLVDGLTHVVMPKFDVDTALEAIATHGVTTTIAVPTQLRRILEADALDQTDLSSLRLLVYGAAPTSLSVVRRAIATLPCGLYQGYGLSEATTNVTALLPEDHTVDASDELLRSCGRVTPGSEVSLRDDDGCRVPVGEPGEIWIRGDKVMSGYWNRPDATSETLVDGWLRTGDIAIEGNDGYYSIVDRSKDMLISGGMNVYPSEIERVLYESPDVVEVAVIGRQDAEWGEVPIAFVIARSGETIDTDDLAARCARQLARPKQPREFRQVDDLPRTATGKVRKTELRRLDRDHAI